MQLRLDEVLNEALKLGPMERAELVEQILASFEFPERKQIDELWAQEAEDRLRAFRAGELEAISAEEVFNELGRGWASDSSLRPATS